MSRRIGQFSFILGLGFLLVYWLSSKAGDPQYNLMWIGVAGILGGIWLMLRNRPQPQESERFRTVKKLVSRRDKKDKEK